MEMEMQKFERIEDDLKDLSMAFREIKQDKGIKF
jgi:hypothetical protein